MAQEPGRLDSGRLGE